MNDRPLLEVHGATCRFGALTALHGVDLSVARGQIHALVGPNGAGKTTLLKLAAGLQRPSAGGVLVGGRPPEVTDRAFCHSVGYLPAGGRTFYLRISGYENLRFFSRLHGLRGAAARDRIAELLELVGLKDAQDASVGSYSTGMRRRLAVARVLIGRPSLLIVDEATHDLDPDGCERIRGVFAERCREGAAVLWATQRLDEIPGFAHRVMVLDRGQVRYSGSVTGLLDRVQEERFVVRLRPRSGDEVDPGAVAGAASHVALVSPARTGEVVLRPVVGVTLGEIIGELQAAGYDVLSCSHDGSPVVDAVRRVTELPVDVPVVGVRA